MYRRHQISIPESSPQVSSRQNITKVQKSYEILSDPDQKSIYDREREEALKREAKKEQEEAKEREEGPRSGKHIPESRNNTTFPKPPFPKI